MDVSTLSFRFLLVLDTCNDFSLNVSMFVRR